MELSRRELNVLRRLLNRHDIAPGDVAGLGLARIEAAQGMGAKGLVKVLEWLAAHGHHLPGAEPVDTARKRERLDRRLEQAQRLLQQWGWQVERPEAESSSCCSRSRPSR